MHAWIRHLEKHLTLKAGQYKYTGTSPPPQSLPTRRTCPASRVTQSCLHTSGAEFTREEGSTAYIHTASLINESSAALTNFPTPAASCIGPACEAGLSIDA